MLDEIFNVSLSLTLKDVGNLMLPVTGTLLGLVYTGLIYWLDAGLARLESTRTLFEDSLVADGKVLLDLLVGASVVSLFAAIEARDLATISFWLFSFRFVADLFNSLKEQGYIKTLFSTKYIPKNYGPIRSYVRKITNLGPIGIFRFLFYFFPTVGYPVLLMFHRRQNYTFSLPDISIQVFIFATSIFALIQIRSLLVQAITVRKFLNKRVLDENYQKALKMEEQVEWPEEKKKINSLIVKKCLEDLGILSSVDLDMDSQFQDWTSRNLKEKPVTIGYSMLNKQGNIAIRILIPYFENDILSREYVYRWVRKILGVFANSKTEIEHYTLTFYRRDTPTFDNHLALFRATKSEALKAKDKLTDIEFVKTLKSRFLSEVIAEF